MDGLARDYVELALATDRLFPGLVDAYYGPPELRPAADVPAEELAARARSLHERALAEPGRAFLAAQARALVTLTRRLDGDELSYAEEVDGLFDVELRWTPDEELDGARRALEAALPGDGGLRERFVAWRGRYELPPERIARAVEIAAAELRARTSELVHLPAGESVEFAQVRGRSWEAYNWYLGELASRVEINVERPVHAHELVDLVAHEAYPGHHTEHAVKEALLFRGAGLGEHGIVLTQAPEALISEGIAELASTAVLRDGEVHRFNAEVLLPAVGMHGEPEREAAVASAMATLRPVLTNAAILRNRDGVPDAAVLDYLREQGLRSEQSARASLAFVSDPLWRAYAITYAAGRELVGAWLAAGPESSRERFARLLTSSVTPAALRAANSPPPTGRCVTQPLRRLSGDCRRTVVRQSASETGRD